MNDANQANFDEINGHIQIIKAKMGSVGGSTEKLIEDMEDYYERGMQLRVMHNTTLSAELEDAKQLNAKLRRRNNWLVGLWILFVIITLIAIAIVACPLCVRTALGTTVVRTAALLLAVAGGSSVLTYYVLSRRAPPRPKVD